MALSNDTSIPASLASPHALTSYHSFHEDLPPSNVPEGYNRFHSDLRPETFPSNRIVGLLACQRDPYLRELKGIEIVAARKAVLEQDKSRSNKKKAKADVKQESSAVETEGETWEVELKDTVLFPEGGGQPNDTGIFSIPSPSSAEPTELQVINVQRRGLSAVHHVRVPKDLQDKVEDILKPGVKVDMRVDWERRWDHMTQHTAQHLLSAILDNHYQLPTLSWALPAHPSTEPCYVELPRGLSQTEIDTVESLCNGLVTRQWGSQKGQPGDTTVSDSEGEKPDVRVWIESRLQSSSTGVSGTATPAVQNVGDTTTDVGKEMEGLGLNGSGSKNEEVAEYGDRESRGLPKDYEGGVIRTAVIDGIDRSLCCGTHQPFLSKIQIMHIIPTTSAKPSPKPTRLYMVAGARAHRHLLQTSRQLTTASLPIGCARHEVAMRVAQREEQRKEATRLDGRLRDALAGAEGRAVAWKESADGIWRAIVERTEESTHDFEFLQSLANHATEHLATKTANQPSDKPPSYLLVVTSNPDPLWVNKTHQAAGAFLQITSSPPELAKTTGDKVKAALDGLGDKGRVKGGGAKGKFMGKVAGGWTARDREASFPDFI